MGLGKYGKRDAKLLNMTAIWNKWLEHNPVKLNTLTGQGKISTEIPGNIGQITQNYQGNRILLSGKNSDSLSKTEETTKRETLVIKIDEEKDEGEIEQTTEKKELSWIQKKLQRDLQERLKSGLFAKSRPKIGSPYIEKKIPSNINKGIEAKRSRTVDKLSENTTLNNGSKNSEKNQSSRGVKNNSSNSSNSEEKTIRNGSKYKNIKRPKIDNTEGEQKSKTRNRTSVRRRIARRGRKRGQVSTD